MQYKKKICHTHPKGLGTSSNLLQIARWNLHFLPTVILVFSTQAFRMNVRMIFTPCTIRFHFKTGFAVESGHERTFSSENLLRQPFLFSKEACKTSQKLSEKGCFRLEFLVFFLCFSSVRDSFFRIFSHKSNVTPHF